MNSENVEESLNKVRVAVDLLKDQQDEKETHKALRILREAIELDSLNILAMHNLAVLLSQMSRTEESINLYKQILQIKPHFEDAWVNLALADIPKAIPRLKEGLRLCPWSAVIWNALGSILAGLEKNEEAERAYLSATEADPRYEPAWLNLFNIYSQTGRKDEAKAILQKAYGGRMFKTLKEMEAQHESLQDFSQELAAQRGLDLPRSSFMESELSSSKGAIILSATYIRPSNVEELRNKLNKNPTIAWLWFELGELYLKLGRYDDAEKSVRRAIRLGSRNRWKNAVLAQILYASGELEGALSEISIATENNETSFWAWKLRKQILDSLGKNRDAKTAEDNMEKFRPMV